MPAIEQQYREPIRKNVNNVQTVGDLNFLLHTTILLAFIGRPRYDTIHELRRLYVTEPKNNPMLNKFRSMFADRFTVGDLYTAAALAFEEAYRRVFAKYEDKKYEINGDIPEVQQLLTIIDGLRTPSVHEAEAKAKEEHNDQSI